MKHFVRKSMSVLLAVCLLCTVLPMGGLLSVSANIDATVNLISNPGFEATGKKWPTDEIEYDVHWNKHLNTALSADAKHTGSYGMCVEGNGTWDGLLTTIVAVEPGSTYDFSFWYKVLNSNVTMKITGVQSEVDYLSQALSNTSWTQYANTFTVSSDTTLQVVFCGANTGMTEKAYVDDFCLTLNKKGTVNYVANGDFENEDAVNENGQVNGWGGSNGISTALVSTNNIPAILQGGGNYSMKVTMSGWGYVNYKVFVTPHTEYEVTFSVLTESTPIAFRVWGKTENNVDGDLCGGSVALTLTKNEWKTFTYTFNSGNNTAVYFRFQCWSNDAATCYVDNAAVTRQNTGDSANASVSLPNGDFENGDLSNWTKHQSTAISADAAHSGSYGVNLKGNGGWDGMLNRNIAVEAGNTYRVSLWLKSNSNGVNFQIKDGGTNGPNLQSKWVTNTEWTKLTYDVTPTTSVLCLNFCGGGNGIAEDVYVDDVDVIQWTSLYLSNGGFETGDLTSWENHSGNSVTTEAARNGNYGVHLKSDGGWGGLMAQSLLNVKEGKTYQVTMNIRAITNGVNINISNNNVTLASKYFSITSYSNGQSKEAGNWQTITLTFRAISNQADLRFVGAGNSLATNVFVDDVQVINIPDREVNLLSHGGKSAMEMADGKGGLGFLFSANIKNFQYTVDNSQTEHLYTVYKYNEQSGKANPYTNVNFSTPYDYTVVRMGAIVSNLTGDNLTLEATEGNARTINIVGKKAMKEWCDDTHYVYGVRVTNVPESAFGRTVYARPYITILIGDEEVTLYGEMESASYQGVVDGTV